MTEAAKLLFWDDSWDLREKECPCDVHFIEWLDREKITGSAIYHFGTGNHHHVGIECARENRRNSVLGITAAPQEYQKYIELAIARPEVLRYYNAVFGDIYLLTRSCCRSSTSSRCSTSASSAASAPTPMAGRATSMS